MGWTQSEAARALGVERYATVGAWEKGQPSERTLRAAAGFAENGTAVLQWLLEGGEQPRILRREIMLREETVAYGPVTRENVLAALDQAIGDLDRLRTRLTEIRRMVPGTETTFS